MDGLWRELLIGIVAAIAGTIVYVRFGDLFQLLSKRWALRNAASAAKDRATIQGLINSEQALRVHVQNEMRLRHQATLLFPAGLMGLLSALFLDRGIALLVCGDIIVILAVITMSRVIRFERQASEADKAILAKEQETNTGPLGAE